MLRFLAPVFASSRPFFDLNFDRHLQVVCGLSCEEGRLQKRQTAGHMRQSRSVPHPCHTNVTVCVFLHRTGNLVIDQHSWRSVEVMSRKPNKVGGGCCNDPHESYKQA